MTSSRQIFSHPLVRFAASLTVAICVGTLISAQSPTPAPAPAQPPAAGRGATPPPGGQERGSPASQRPPQSTTQQAYPPEQIKAGQPIFAAQCGFCHGRDANGGETGPDLTRSPLVAEDVRGDKIGAVVRTGRLDKGMPAFTLSDADLAAVVAFIHDAKARAESLVGDRRTVDVSDLQTGDAEQGRQYFNGPGGCAKCHSPTGDFAGLATRIQGLTLLQRMLYPSGRGRGGASRPAAKVTVTDANGQTISGSLGYRDEFTVTLIDADGWHRSFPTRLVKFTVDDPLEAHSAQLSKYTDKDMHDVLAYLHTLR
jgi:cytochrome c oxidase cbb3-type subunit 3